MKKFRRMLYLKLARLGRGSNAPVPSIVSFGTRIKGNILSGDVVHIDGRLDGNITCDELIIGVKGQVTGQIKVKTLSIYGTLQGATEVDNVFIAGSARVAGDVFHKSIAIEPGAYVEGRCVRMSESKSASGGETIAAAVKNSVSSAGDSSLFKAASGGK